MTFSTLSSVRPLDNDSISFALNNALFSSMIQLKTSRIEDVFESSFFTTAAAATTGTTGDEVVVNDVEFTFVVDDNDVVADVELEVVIEVVVEDDDGTKLVVTGITGVVADDETTVPISDAERIDDVCCGATAAAGAATTAAEVDNDDEDDEDDDIVLVAGFFFDEAIRRFVI